VVQECRGEAVGERAVVDESGTGGLVGAGATPPLDVRDLVGEVECLLPPIKGQRGAPAGVEDHFPYVPWADGIVAGGLVEWLGHALPQCGEIGENLLVVAEQAEKLQPLALVAQLGPGPEPGLGGVLDGLVCESECLGRPALSAQQQGPGR
jgi:hypothetical protein